jgi:hypothetical protein
VSRDSSLKTGNTIVKDLFDTNAPLAGDRRNA